jgi:hypothetical protein
MRERITHRLTVAYCVPNGQKHRSALQIRALAGNGTQDALMTIEDN